MGVRSIVRLQSSAASLVDIKVNEKHGMIINTLRDLTLNSYF